MSRRPQHRHGGLAGLAGDLDRLAGLARALHRLEKRTREDYPSGTIEMVETAPGVFVAPKTPPKRKRASGVVGVLEQLGNLGEELRKEGL